MKDERIGRPAALIIILSTRADTKIDVAKYLLLVNMEEDTNNLSSAYPRKLRLMTFFNVYSSVWAEGTSKRNSFTVLLGHTDDRGMTEPVLTIGY